MIRSRDFDKLSEAQIAAGGTARRGVTADAGFRPPAPKTMSELLDTIQHVAEAATGERSFLHLSVPPKAENRRQPIPQRLERD